MKVKRSFILAGLCLVAFSSAQRLPFETEATRRNITKTGGNVLIKGGRVLTVTKGTHEVADVLVRNGKIVDIKPNITPPPGTTVIDATGKVVTPGIVDAHIHRGMLSTNEGSESITGEVRMRDVLNPDAKNVWQALAGGETSGLALHGSASQVGGESVVIKLKYGAKVEEMPVPDAPRMIKFALGENVTRSGSSTSTRYPKTRMGVQATYRRAFTEAREYINAWEAWEKNKSGKPPRKDLRLEALADILRGKIWVQCHSYRADEMLMMARLSKEFGFKIGAMQHALEAYKIAPELAELGVPVSIFVDNWSFKIEGYDSIPFTASICTQAGVLVSINTDGTGGMPSIAMDGAKPMRYGGLTEDQCMAMLTINPARQIGIDHRAGSLEPGKDGDIVIWDGHPLSVYGKARMSLIEGEVYFERKDAFGVDSASKFKTKLDKNRRTPMLPMPRESSAYAITGATIHTVSGDAIENGTVVMRDGKITAVGKNVEVGNAVRVNASGLHIYPGFIDAGSSIGLAEISGIGQMVDTTELGNNHADLTAYTAVQIQSEHLPVARYAGVLTSLTRPTGGLISGQASIINTFGWTSESLKVGDGILVVNYPASGTPLDFDLSLACCDYDFLGGEYNPQHDLSPEYRHLLKQHNHDECEDQDHDHDHLLGGGQPGGGGGGSQSGSELDAIIAAAKKYYDVPRSAASPTNLTYDAMRPFLEGKQRLLLRVRSASSIRSAVAWAEKHNLKVILSGAADAWKEATLLASKKIPVLIQPAGKSTLSANSPANDWDPYDTPFALPALLKRAGVKFAFQSDENAASNNLAVRVGQSCAYGLSQEDAIRALTLSAAEILGVEKQLGSIDVGKLGNLVIADGDPMEMTTNIVGIYVGGRPVEMQSRHTRLRDQYLKRLTPFEREYSKRQG